jgi:toxin FitB
VSGFLLDTNVISELVRPRPAPQVTSWIEAIGEDALYLSVLTLGEIRKGIASLPPGPRSSALESWLNSDLPIRFAARILAVDAEIADRWGRLSAHTSSARKPLPVVDGLLAATALHHNLVLVTRNITDIETTGVSSFNPWRN